MTRRRWVAAGVVTVLAVGAAEQAARGGTATQQGVQVVQAGRVYCWPAARTIAQQTQGLSGQTHVELPLVFTFTTPRVASLTMQGARAALTGVWLGTQGRVSGVWHGRPGLRTYTAKGLVSGAIEYPAGWPAPAVGQRVTFLGSCGAPSL